jgi:hypothetical protein
MVPNLHNGARYFICKFSCFKKLSKETTFGWNVIKNLAVKGEQTTLVGICIRIVEVGSDYINTEKCSTVVHSLWESIHDILC